MRPGSWAVVFVALALCARVAAAGPHRPHGRPGPIVQAKGPDPAEVTKIETELAQLQVKQDFGKAIKLARHLYDLYAKAYGKDDVRATSMQQRIASLLQQAGNYSEALAMYKELVADAEKKHGPESREVEYALMAMSGVYYQSNRLDELEPIEQRMVAISKKLDGEHSKAYAQQLQTYGAMLFMHNEYTAAERIYEQALQIDEDQSGANSTDLLSPMQMLGNLYWQTNQRPKAIALFDRAQKIATSAPGATALSTGSTLWGIAAIYHWGGRDDLANPLMKRVLAMYDQEIARLEKDKPDDYQISSMLGMSGYMLQQLGDFAGAEQRMKRAVDFDEKARGFSGWISMLAELERQNGKPKEALAMLEKARDEMAKLSPASANAYNVSIALVLRQLGDFKRAEKLLVAYLDDNAKKYGRHHPVYGMAELQLAFAYMGAGEVGKAEHYLSDSLELAEHELQLVLKTGTDSDHAVYFAKNGYLLDTAINFNYALAPKSPSATRLALLTLLRRKGRALDAAAAAMATIRKKLSPEDKQLLDQLAAARAKLAKLTVAGPQPGADPDAYAKQVADLEDEVTKLELQLGKRSAAYRKASLQIELAPIQKLIPRGTRLVEIVNFQPSDPKATWTPNMVLAPRHYVAYVLASTGDPVLVDLAPAPAIDEAVAKFRKAVADPDNDSATDLGHALFQLTMAKVIPALGGATDILIAPDGTLNVVPFSALVDDKGDFLIKKYTFTYLTSGRDLLRLAVRTKPQGGGVIIANPSFDATGATPAGAPSDVPTSRGRRSADLSSFQWPPLPGTGKEAKAVASTMHGFTILTGSAATESAVKAVHGPRILHLATHGFFLPDEAPPPQAANQNRGGMPMLAPPTGASIDSGNASENPLLRSGLALAGANKLESGSEDGILTALEASGLDLEGTQLVVLSACETGVGTVTNGDGVYGLRRALVVAGAESLVMSLWQVDDEATKELMVGYYKRLAHGESRSSALREVQLELLSRDKYKHPYFWASFLPAGDNSPLKE